MDFPDLFIYIYGMVYRFSRFYIIVICVELYVCVCAGLSRACVYVLKVPP